jgi:hypothetical protein
MKKLTIAIAITASLTYAAYCQYIVKTGEYTPSGYTSYKICEYGRYTLKIDRYGICPQMISVDTYTGELCY